MPETPIEKLMGWLTREEEEFGLTGAIERTIDPAACRRMLLDELGYEPPEAQADLMYRAGRYRYESLPQIGISTSQVTYPWGTQTWYRDIPTGRRVGTEAVWERMELMGL